MKLNPEITKIQHVRMAIGTFLVLVGVLVLIFSFLTVPLVFVGILLIIAGVFIAKSARLAELVYGLLS